jgi:hypothetical protein
MDIAEQINIIMRQTNYTKEESYEKLKECDFDTLSVIKNYMGISLKKENKIKKSLQQEMYSQIRKQMDLSIKDFNNKQYEKLEKDIENLNKE